MSDDHAVSAIGCYQGFLSDVTHTPNIDRLAEESLLFENVFATNSICSPSRATILTGKYSHKNGVYILNEPFAEQQTSASILQNAGYETAVFGKWHLKSLPSGFDDFKVLREQGRYRNPEFVEKMKDTLTEYKGWSEDIITDMTIDFLTTRDQDKPFLVMTQFKSAHDPWASRVPFDTLFSHIKIPEPANICDDYSHRSDAASRVTLQLSMMDQKTFNHDRLDTSDICAQRKYIYQQYIKAYLRCAAVMDYNVGRLMDYLEKTGLDENTIVIYTSDQGHFLGEHGYFSKRLMYDESIRMPLIIRHPEMRGTSRRNNQLVANIDFAPTVVDLANQKVPDDMQGASLKPFLMGASDLDWRSGIYYRYWQHILHRDVAAHYGIRTSDHKLIFYHGLSLGHTDKSSTPPEWELFDLRQDPAEMINVYGDPAYQDVVNSLKADLHNLRVQYDDNDTEMIEEILAQGTEN